MVFHLPLPFASGGLPACHGLVLTHHHIFDSGGVGLFNARFSTHMPTAILFGMRRAARQRGFFLSAPSGKNYSSAVAETWRYFVEGGPTVHATVRRIGLSRCGELDDAPTICGS